MTPLKQGFRFCREPLLEGIAKLFLVLHLVPTQEMHNARVIDQIQPKALGIAPLTVSRGASGPRVTLPILALPRAVGTRGHIRPIDAQHQHRAAKAPSCHFFNTVHNLLA